MFFEKPLGFATLDRWRRGWPLVGCCKGSRWNDFWRNLARRFRCSCSRYESSQASVRSVAYQLRRCGRSQDVLL